MRRVHTTYDLLEGHILTNLLRAHGIEAWLFDAAFVRQNWLQSIAYGGYRIMVRDEDAAAAQALLQEQRAGKLALEQDTAEPCPYCARAAGVEDPQPRRNVFLAVILYFPLFDAVFFTNWHASPQQLFAEVAALLVAATCVPWRFIHYLKWRLRCDQCGYRWRQPPQHRHAELARMIEEASRIDAPPRESLPPAH